MLKCLTAAGAALILLSSNASQAADPVVAPVVGEYPPPEQAEPRPAFGAYFSMGLGVIDILANEYVWAQNGFGGTSPPLDWKLSQLIWETRAPVVEFAAGFEVGRFTVDADLSLAFRGDSHMEDYDWIAPFAPGNGPDDWTHRSVHELTNLLHYRSAALALGIDVVDQDGLTVNINTGFQYIDVMWEAYGGDFTYSSSGFRDTVFSLPDDLLVIDYRQKWPIVFAGIDLEASRGPLSLGASFRGGVAINATNVDNHYLRCDFGCHLVISEQVYPAPFLHVGGRAEYALGPNLLVFVQGGLDKIFETRSDKNRTWPGLTFDCTDGCGGADFRSMYASIGLRLALGGGP
jgi:outer membrane protease